MMMLRFSVADGEFQRRWCRDMPAGSVGGTRLATFVDHEQIAKARNRSGWRIHPRIAATDQQRARRLPFIASRLNKSRFGSKCLTRKALKAFATVC
ncbi:MAG: hypothetical protein U1F70_05375 [Candidatus Competibacteraceae bacterium]